MSINRAFLEGTLKRITDVKKSFSKYEADKEAYDRELVDYKNAPPHIKKNLKQPKKPDKPKFGVSDNNNLSKIKDFVAYHVRNKNIDPADMVLANQIITEQIIKV